MSVLPRPLFIAPPMRGLPPDYPPMVVWCTSPEADNDSSFNANIIRLLPDGTSDGSSLGDSGANINTPHYLAVVDGTVWVTDGGQSIRTGGNASNGHGRIWTVAPDGTGLTLLVDLGSGTPCYGLAVVGDEVWVLCITSYVVSPLAGTGTIKRYAFDGSSAGSDITGNGLSHADFFSGLEVVGSEVWVPNGADATISRFDFAGGAIGSPVSCGTYVLDALAVGDQAWVTDLSMGNVHRLDFTGATAAADLPGGGVGLLRHCSGIATIGVNAEVWVGNANPPGKPIRVQRDGTETAATTDGAHGYGLAAVPQIDATLKTPPPVQPNDGASPVSRTPTLMWLRPTTGSLTYRVQVGTNAHLLSTLIDITTSDPWYVVPSALAATTTHYWRVQVDGASPWSDTWRFVTTT